MGFRMIASRAALVLLLTAASASWGQSAVSTRTQAAAAQPPASQARMSANTKATSSAARRPSGALAHDTEASRRERISQAASKMLKKTGESASAVAGNIK